MAAERRNIGPAGRLDVLAHRDRSVHDVVESHGQRIAVALQPRVLLGEPVHDRTDAGLALRDPGEGQIFLRMMQHVRVMRHVEHDVQHQLVVGGLAAVKAVELDLEEVEQVAKLTCSACQSAMGSDMAIVAGGTDSAAQSYDG